MNPTLITEITDYYYSTTDNDRATYFEGALMALDNEEYHDKFGWCDDYKLRQLYIWADYEELPQFVATALHEAGCDIQETLTKLLMDQRELDREAREDLEDLMQTYKEAVGC